MTKNIKITLKCFFGFCLFFTIFITGCAPGPLPSPVFPGLIGMGLAWIFMGIIMAGGIFLWKKYNSSESSKANYLTEALNAINKRLKNLEEKMEQMEKNRDNNKK